MLMASEDYRWWKPLLWVPVLCLVVLAVAYAQDDEMVIQYRQKVMAGHGNNISSIGDIMKNKLPHAATQISLHAKILAEYSGLIEGAFEKNISAGATDSEPEIWKNWNDFLAKANALGDASAKLSEVAQSGDMRATMTQVQAVGDTCRGCHDSYRKPEEESYKRK
jgi:cytochrome c556